MSNGYGVLKGKSIQEINRAIDDVGRPMRWPQAEIIARRFSRAVMDEWIKTIRRLFEVMRDVAGDEFPTFNSALMQSRKAANPTPEDVARLVFQLSQYLSPAQIDAIDRIFNESVPGFFSDGGSPFSQTGHFNRYLRMTMQDGYRQGYDNLVKAARSHGLLDEFYDRTEQFYDFDPNSPVVSKFFSERFELVTSKITIAAKGEAFKEILVGLQDGKAWRDIAQGLMNRVGTGYLWHWERLVRTEMTTAYYHSFMERYQNAGAGYVMLSLSIGACPKCVGLDGYYILGMEPALTASTHPNCRCVYIPFFRLPEGVTIRG